jgi:crotonobetainyl-CoA:carnitine CoA-transferase CaiB-like acyl-CoA transferase
MSERALDGVRIVAIGPDPAVAFASRLLADLGADVVVVEPSSAPAADLDEEQSGLRQFLGWNKRSVSVELGTPELGVLLDAADIVMVGLPPTSLGDQGLDPVPLGRRLPRAVLTYLTPFGLDGPYADFHASDLVLQAMSGMMAISGSSDREPLKHGQRTSIYTAGLNAAYATVAALRTVDRTGSGVALDLAVRDCLTSELVMNNALAAFTGIVQARPTAVADPLDGHPIAGARGHLSLQTSARQPIERWAEFFADDRLLAPDFSTPERRMANAVALRAIIAEHLDREPARELFERAAAEGLILGFVQGAGELLDCPHLEERGVFVDVPAADRTWRLPAQLATLSGTPTDVRRLASEPGQDTDEVLAEWSVPRDATTPRVADPAVADGPLAGLRVLDLSVIFAVPYLGAVMADLGADVVKVEAPARLDQTRTDWGGYLDNDPGADPWNRSGTFHVVNRGKRSVAIDLKTADGRALLRRLVAPADVLLDNFTPRVMRDWGMTYQELAELNPGLVMLSNTGYGATGPWSSFKAQGTTLEATMGLMSVTGYADRSPTRAGQSVPDFYACWVGLLAIGAALRHRDRTGAGQCIDIGMYQLGPSVLPEALIHHQVHGEDPPLRGARDLGSGFSAVVPACGTDRWLAVSAGTPEQQQALRLVVGAEHPLDEAVRRWSRERDAYEAMHILQSRGIAAGPLLDAGDLTEDPQLRHRRFYEPIELPGTARPLGIIGRPYRWMSRASRVGVPGPGPDFAADNDAVLREWLGVDDAELTSLRACAALADEPRTPPPARSLDLALLLATGTVSRLTADRDTTHERRVRA